MDFRLLCLYLVFLILTDCALDVLRKCNRLIVIDSLDSDIPYLGYINQNQSSSQLRSGFMYFISNLAEPDYDGKGAQFCIKSLWHSPYLELMTDDCLQALADVVTANQTAIHRWHAARLLSWFPAARTSAIIANMPCENANNDLAELICSHIGFLLGMQGDINSIASSRALIRQVISGNCDAPWGVVQNAIIVITHQGDNKDVNLFACLKRSEYMRQVPDEMSRLDLRIDYLKTSDRYGVVDVMKKYFIKQHESGTLFFYPHHKFGGFLTEFYHCNGWDHAFQLQLQAADEIESKHLSKGDSEVTYEMIVGLDNKTLQEVFYKKLSLKQAMLAMFTHKHLYRSPY